MRIFARCTIAVSISVCVAVLGAPPVASQPTSSADASQSTRSRLAGGLRDEQEAVRRLRERFAALPDDIECLSDIVYRRVGERNLDFDVYRPTTPPPSSRPGVIYVHGGGWRGGDRRMNRGLFVDLARRGYVVFSVDYRLVPDAIFPACIEDCEAALRFIRAHAGDYRLDPARIGLIGASAGGHLVALMGVAGNDEFRTADNARQDQHVAAVVALYGVFDLRHLPRSTGAPLVTGLLGGPESARPDAYRRASPQAFVEATASQPVGASFRPASPASAPAARFPPFLFIHGDADRLIDIGQAEHMNAALRAAGCDSELIIVHNGGHGLTTGHMNPPPEVFHRRMYEFLDRRLKPPSRGSP